MIKVLCLVALLAVAFAQLTPQTGPLNVQTVTPGVTVSGTLPVTSPDVVYHLDLYSFFVAENVSSVNVTFVDTDTTACSYITLYVSTFNIPCDDSEYSSSYYQCANAYDVGNGIYDYSQIWTAYDSSYLFRYSVNQYWYVGIGKYYSSDYDELCTYQFSLSYNYTCTPGSVGIAVDSTNSQCEPYTTVNGSTIYTVMNVNPTGDNDYIVYKIPNLSNVVGNILVQINSSSTGLYIYGQSHAAPSDYSDYNCYTGSYTTVGGMYIYSLYCYTPLAGDFFVTLEDANDYNATIQFFVNECAAGMAGPNCTWPLLPFNASLLVAPTTINVPYSGSSSDLQLGSIYFYWDIPANYSAGDIILFANSPQSGYFVIGRNGFPTSASGSGYIYSSQYDSYDAILALNQFDYQVGGRYYMLLNCYSSTGCNVTVSLNATSTSSGSSGVATTGSAGTNTTSVVMTTGATGVAAVTTGVVTGSVATTAEAASPASVIVPSFVALAAAAIFAMF